MHVLSPHPHLQLHLFLRRPLRLLRQLGDILVDIMHLIPIRFNLLTHTHNLHISRFLPPIVSLPAKKIAVGKQGNSRERD